MEISKHKGITFSLCLPSTCTSELLSRGFDFLGEDINYLLDELHANETVSFVIDDRSCHAEEPMGWSSGQIVGA